MIFFRYMILELGPDMMYMDLRDSFYPYLVHLGFSKMGVASRAHFKWFSVEPNLKEIRIF